MAGLIDTLFARRKAAESAAVDDYRGLVERIADNGKEPTTDVAEAVLQKAGRTPEQLSEDVDLLLRRRVWAATVASEPEVLEGLRPIDELRAAEKADFEAKISELRRRHTEVMATLGTRQAELLDRLNRVNDARVRLQESAARFAEYVAVCGQYEFVHEQLCLLPAEIRRAGGSPRLAASLARELESAQAFANHVREQAAAIEAELVRP